MDPAHWSYNTRESESRERHTMVEIHPQGRVHQQGHQQCQGDSGIEGGTPSSALVRSASLRRRSGRRTQIATAQPQDGREMASAAGLPAGIELQHQQAETSAAPIYPNLAEVVEDLENIKPLHEKIAARKKQ